MMLGPKGFWTQSEHFLLLSPKNNQKRAYPMNEKANRSISLLYFTLYLAVALTLALSQPLSDNAYPPLSNPPDEHSRYLVPLYICNHGTLPTGFEEELISGDCRWTYGFYTLLPYMVQGYAMRFVNLFTDSPLALLFTARLVNVALGLIMAYIVLLLGKKLFSDNRVRWLFCFLVTFLPQSIFLHSYVNPDSMCLLSTALMIYGLVRGYGDGFSLRSCAFLAVGVILCALSYYNAYGFILGSILLFAAYFLKKENGKYKYDWRNFLKKGLGISAVVLLCISWSFIRNYMLYDGDIIGLETKENFIKSFGIERNTYYSDGQSLISMLTGTNYFFHLFHTAVAVYGSVSILTWGVVYRFYFLVFLAGILGAVFCRKRAGADSAESDSAGAEIFGKRKGLRNFFHGVMIFCMAMPLILLIRYAYTVDFQAQGRYILPGIIPFMYYTALGWKNILCRKKVPRILQNILFAALLLCIVSSLLIMVYVSALPVYMQGSVL